MYSYLRGSYKGPAQSALVRFKSSVPADMTLEWRRADEMSWKRVINPEPTTDHYYLLTDLKPGKNFGEQIGVAGRNDDAVSAGRQQLRRAAVGRRNARDFVGHRLEAGGGSFVDADPSQALPDGICTDHDGAEPGGDSPCDCTLSGTIPPNQDN